MRRSCCGKHPILKVCVGAFVGALLLGGAYATANAKRELAGPNTQPATQSQPAHGKTADRHDAPPLSPLVTRLLHDAVTLPAEKTELRLFHGQWSDLPKSLTRAQKAHLALLRFDLDNPALKSKAARPSWQAEAALDRGEPRAAMALLAKDDRPRAMLVKAKASEQLGQTGKAIDLLKVIAKDADKYQHSAPDLTAAAEGMILLAQLEGLPAANYQEAMNLLGQAHEQIDPLYWPALVAEAETLMARDNLRDANKSLVEALRLDPKSSRAWYDFGVIGVDTYDFGKVTLALKQLRTINPDHLLADELQIREALTQKDIHTARRVVIAAIKRYPNQRDLLALQAATQALANETGAMTRTLAYLDKLSPGSPRGFYVVGQNLSRARQYEQAAAMLREAISRAPNWPAPHDELGLLLMQWGRLHEAETVLVKAAALDPFNRQVGNQLQLVKRMLGYPTIETPHFIIRYQPGVDSALAHDMPRPLEKMYADVTHDFGYKPKVKTEIDLMPDEHAFAVRITGMPDIWTIAACTGSCIALTPPRNGANQHGPFDWTNVIRHEFTHTVTLGETHNRVPHWFTEACAVSEQQNVRSYDTCQLLAWALAKNKLFALDQINWGFVRPKRPYGRQLAYAQARWMLAFIDDRWSHQAIIDLLHLYDQDVGNVDAIRQVTHLGPDQFMTQFKAWARQQVASWGLSPEHLPKAVAEAIAGKGSTPGLGQIKRLLKADPHAADLLKLYAAALLKQRPIPAGAKQAVQAYAQARPVDPWAQRMLVKLAVKADDLDAAIAPLKQLNKQEREDGSWAYELARIQRRLGRLGPAAEAIISAVHHEPYNPMYRAFAATVYLQLKDPRRALEQLKALAMLEPDEAIHEVQLAALYSELGEPDKADAAARAARKIDPKAPVSRFLKEGAGRD